eukprot:854280-Pelagomonas_calceolata.AAC.1
MGWTVCPEGLKFHLMQGLRQGYRSFHAGSQVSLLLLSRTLSPPLSQQPSLPQRPGLLCEWSTPSQTSKAHYRFCWTQIAAGPR